MLDWLAYYVATHRRARAAFDAAVNVVINSQPYLPGLGWFVAVFYGCLAVLCALGSWWPGVAVSCAFGGASWWLVRRIRAGARDLELLVAEQETERLAGGRP